MVEQPIQWTKNRYNTTVMANSRREEILPAELPQKICRFHRQLPGYRMSPLKGLSNLATRLGLGGILGPLRCPETHSPMTPITKWFIF
jgi:diaminopropionate ammonia-lyase